MPEYWTRQDAIAFAIKHIHRYLYRQLSRIQPQEWLDAIAAAYEQGRQDEQQDRKH